MNHSIIPNQRDFVDFLLNLAPEGETLLVVRQKPQLKDREIQLHADGAVKCTWPAFLPTAKLQPDWAVYANTASFIIDRFTEGKPSAASANCEYVLCMVLDDVGDPDKAPNLPPLAPTWKMETSSGSFQWGYVFSVQPTKAKFSAAIRAIADAGYTDPGACNPVRNFRLPGSVNLKPNKNRFAAQLVEFDASLEYSLDDICAAFGVTPAQDTTTEYRPIRVADDGNDDIVDWLSTNSMVLSKPNPQGWMGITCPNNAEHTDGNPEGRYHPATRGFCCLHSHCIDFDSTIFLQWVHDQGGPKHEQGLRDTLLAQLHSNTLAKLTPNAIYPDTAAHIVAEIERKEAGRVEKADWYTRFAYIQNDDSYFDLESRSEVSRGTFNALFRHISCVSNHNGRKIEASTCFDENRQKYGAPAISSVTYAAGEAILCTRDGEVYGNRWRDARPVIPAGTRATEISLWLDHCARLVPEPSELNHIFDMMACKLQYPNVKINHALLHGGTQGCGKDTMYAPFIWSVCGEFGRNKGLLDGDSLSGQWGYQLESEILILNELREPDARDRRAMANRLKPIIAAPPDMLPINRKGLHPYMMLNRLMVLAFSNDPVPIVLDSSDRRWFAVWSNAPRLTPERATELWQWYKTGGFESIALWLLARDVSAFNPAATPLMTEYKHTMISNGLSSTEEYLVDIITREAGEFSKGIIGAPFHALRDKLLAGAPIGVKIPQGALLHALTEAGWHNLGRVSSRRHPSKKQVFISPNMRSKNYSYSDLRDMIEVDYSPSKVVAIR